MYPQHPNPRHTFSPPSPPPRGGYSQLPSQSFRGCLSVIHRDTLFWKIPRSRSMWGVISHISNPKRRTTWTTTLKNIPYNHMFTPSCHNILGNLGYISAPFWGFPPQRSIHHPIYSGLCQVNWMIIRIICSHLTYKVEYIVHVNMVMKIIHCCIEHILILDGGPITINHNTIIIPFFIISSLLLSLRYSKHELMIVLQNLYLPRRL